MTSCYTKVYQRCGRGFKVKGSHFNLLTGQNDKTRNKNETQTREPEFTGKSSPLTSLVLSFLCPLFHTYDYCLLLYKSTSCLLTRWSADDKYHGLHGSFTFYAYLHTESNNIFWFLYIKIVVVVSQSLPRVICVICRRRSPQLFVSASGGRSAQGDLVISARPSVRNRLRRRLRRAGSSRDIQPTGRLAYAV